MKKSLVICLALAALCSCSRYSESDSFPGWKILSASTPESSTKTSIGNAVQGGYEIIWSEGDRIAVNGSASEPLSAAQAGGATASFSVSEEVSSPYDVIYPAEALISAGKVRFPGNQTWNAGQFDPKAAILTAHSSSEAIAFVNSSAFIRVTIRKAAAEILKEIKLYSYAGEPMSGIFTVDYTTGQLSVDSDTRNFVSVSAEGNIPYNAAGYAVAVFAVPAGEYSKGFAISATTTDGVQMGKAAYGTSGITLTGGDLLAMPELTFTGGSSLYSGGSGTAVDPYLIATAKDLQTLSSRAAAASENGHFKQVADIDMSGIGNFTPIGSADKVFAGVYDGNGRIIENLTINATDVNSGLFGYLKGASAKLCNINLKNAIITASAGNTSVLCGFGYQGDIDNCSFSACSITSTGDSGAGLVCGRPYILTVTNCHADTACTVSGKSAVGGIIGGGTTYGTGYGLLIKDCTYLGNVIGTGDSIGGIIGGGVTMKKVSSVTIKNCTTVGNVTGDGAYVGGIMGGLNPSSSSNLNTTEMLVIDSCFASGNIKGKHSIGGIIGYCYGGSGSAVVINCGYTGDELESTTISGSDGYCAVGGILGWNRAGSASMCIANCYSHVRTIRFATGTGTPVSYGAGGILGYTSVSTGSTRTIEIRGCYSIIAMSGFFYNGTAVTASQVGFGGLYGSFSSTLSAGNATVADSWYSGADVKGDTRFPLKSNTSAVYSDLNTLLSKLNTFASTYTYGSLTCQPWKKNSAGYPILGSSSDDETAHADLSGGTENEGEAGSDGGNFENNDFNDPVEW